ncbi:hypothetical protein DXA38_14910 [[Clostridium] innocuum]|uniref:Uncharacterized protein n=1 Tax=Clostridium innocuum TaxID=1522 RepID=A0A3E2VT34_CLOIN|nr:hypothetical protein DXA38_14910 [[Clostridium] innocuum]RHV62545.1 hypothetical protein DXB22_15435 [Clostridiaceae bacterium OM02-2AC]
MLQLKAGIEQQENDMAELWKGKREKSYRLIFLREKRMRGYAAEAGYQSAGSDRGEWRYV